MLRFLYEIIICNPPARNFCEKKAGETAPGCVPWTPNSRSQLICLAVELIHLAVVDIPCDENRVYSPYIDLFSRGDYVSSKNLTTSAASYFEINPVTVDLRKRLVISSQFIMHTSGNGWYQRILELRMSTDLRTKES